MTPDRSGESLTLFRFKLAGKIALSVSAAACAALTVALLFVTDENGATYGEIIRAFSLSRAHLAPALLVAGLFLVALAAFVTWLITLYGSFRVAGPLFRFARNLEQAIAQGPGAPQPIRKDDQLQREAQQLARSLAALQQHYGAMRGAAGQALDALAAKDAPAAAQAVARIRELDGRVRL